MSAITLSTTTPPPVPCSSATPDFNYIIEIQKLVATIFAQLSRISANEHEATEHLKNAFMRATNNSASCQLDSGRIGKNLSIAAFAVAILRVGFPNADDKEIIHIFSQQIPSFASMYTSSLQSEMHQQNAIASLDLERYRSKSAAKQSEGGSKQDLLSLLQNISENLKNASRS